MMRSDYDDAYDAGVRDGRDGKQPSGGYDRSESHKKEYMRGYVEGQAQLLKAVQTLLQAVLNQGVGEI